MIVIGADVHDSAHALAAVEAATGELPGEREIRAKEQGHLDALRTSARGGADVGSEDSVTYPTTSSKRSLPPASECLGSRRS